MTSIVFDSFTDDVFRANIAVASDTFYGMLVTSSYAPDKGGDLKRSDVADEVVGTGYVAGGQAITATLTKDASAHNETIAFADNTWVSPTTVTARAQVVYKHRGGLATADELVAYGDFGSDVVATAGTFTAQFTAPITYDNS